MGNITHELSAQLDSDFTCSNKHKYIYIYCINFWMNKMRHRFHWSDCCGFVSTLEINILLKCHLILFASWSIILRCQGSLAWFWDSTLHCWLLGFAFYWAKVQKTSMLHTCISLCCGVPGCIKLTKYSSSLKHRISILQPLRAQGYTWGGRVGARTVKPQIIFKLGKYIHCTEITDESNYDGSASFKMCLTHWGRVIHLCVGKLTIIIPPATKLGGYIGFTLSVCLSICLSVCPFFFVSAL